MNYNYDNDGFKVGYKQLENLGQARDINADIAFGTIIDKGSLRDIQKRLDKDIDHGEVFIKELEAILQNQSVYQLLNKDDIQLIKSDKSLKNLHIIQCKSAVLYVLGYIFQQRIGLQITKIPKDKQHLINTLASIASNYKLSILSVLRYARFWQDKILKGKANS